MKMLPLKLTYDIYIAAPIDRVWSALIDGALTEKYFYGTRVESSFAKGAALVYTAGDTPMVEGTVVEVVPGRLLELSQRFVWDPAVAADAPSKVRWELESMGDATKLSLIHDGFVGETETFKQSAGGWPVVLSASRRYSKQAVRSSCRKRREADRASLAGR